MVATMVYMAIYHGYINQRMVVVSFSAAPPLPSSVSSGRKPDLLDLMVNSRAGVQFSDAADISCSSKAPIRRSTNLS